MIGIIFSTCLAVITINRIVVFQHYGNGISFSFYTLFWIWFTIIPDAVVLLILYTLLFYVGWKYREVNQYGIVLGLGFAAFIIFVSSCNILMLTITGM
jgi:hypothetical protein